MGMMDIETALTRIRALIEPVRDHQRVLLHDACGRVLAADIHAPIDVPPFRNSAVDGYACRSAEIDAHRTIEVVGESFAGHPYAGDAPRGSCVRIMTGAVVPAGYDTVVMQEHVSSRDGQIVVGAASRVGENIREPGEDIRCRALLLPVGRRLTAADLGLLASLGVSSVDVLRKLRVAYLSTGDELLGPSSTLSPGKIYDSNRYTLRALLQRPDVESFDLGIIPDQPQSIENALREAASLSDIVISSGGVSVGEADFVKPALQALGQIDFWKLAIKPGKPLAFGRLGDAVFFGLPGNPVSAMVTYYLMLYPAIAWMSGSEVAEHPKLHARTLEKLFKQPGRQDYQRGVYSVDVNGEIKVRTTGIQGSHVLTSMSQANCLIVVPRESGDLPEGALVEIIPMCQFL